MEKQNAIYPGKPWLDTEGKRIQAHGGSVMYLDGTYYWYGENKEKTTGQNDIWHWGVRCYSSKDLYNWKDEGVIIPPEPDDPTSSMHPSAYMDRPHIIYNKKNNKFVCWLKNMHADGTQTETIMVADHILGPYTKVNQDVKPLGMSAGDFDLAVADDGEGIPPEQIAQIWDRYYRVDKEHRCAVMGSGLGLSIVKGVMEAHNASYGVESAVGAGSVFWFELPLATEE